MAQELSPGTAGVHQLIGFDSFSKTEKREESFYVAAVFKLC
jgi:hypothetical protein